MPKEYFSIGKVSAMFDISVQTLRHYDKIGLLTPDHVKASSGYRYYSVEKIRDLEHILYFKQMDMTLPEIAAALDSLRDLAMPLEKLLSLEASRITRQIEQLHKKRQWLERCLSSCETDIPEIMKIKVVGLGERRYRRVAIDPVSPSDENYYATTMPARKRAIAGKDIMNFLELGELCSMEDYRHSGRVRYHSVISGMGEEDGTFVAPAGSYLTIAYRRSRSSEEEVLELLQGCITRHSLEAQDDVLLLSRDLVFAGPTGRGDLSEAQVGISL